MLHQDSHTQWQDAVCELQAPQHYHYHWHLMRLEGSSNHARLGSGLPREKGTRGKSSSELVVLGCFVEGHMRGAAKLRWQPSDRHNRAEIDFSVEDRWQGRGIGTALTAAAIEMARQRGITNLYLTCHALNRRVQRIAERFGATVGFEGCECYADIAVGTQQQRDLEDLRM